MEQPKHNLLTKNGELTAEETRDLVRAATDSSIFSLTNVVGSMSNQMSKQREDIDDIKNSLRELRDILKEQNSAFSVFVKRCNPVIEAFEQQKVFKSILTGKASGLVKFFVGLSAVITGVVVFAQFVLKPLIINLMKNI